MGEVSDDDHAESPQHMWEALTDHANRIRGPGFGLIADQRLASGPPPRSLRGTPLIIDTDIGGDPDDAIALSCAALTAPELALVITSDEYQSDRARFARHLLDLLGRPDVPVVSGAQLGDTRYWVVDDLFPGHLADPAEDIMAAVTSVCTATDGPVRWVGMGPLTNLKRILTEMPQLAGQLVITQTGGAINYRDPARASHNFRLDPNAAVTVINKAAELRLVISDITTNDAIVVRRGDQFYTRLTAPGSPAWAALLGRHFDRWFDRFHPYTHQHDSLTLTAALRLPFVTFTKKRRFRIEPDARMFLDDNGHNTWLANGADYTGFLNWLNTHFTW
ncbi:nucleoside hydrolase [Nocardia wallacei]|uniref:nucleoside hydrolase n=1 Tax=Nocardia wallacei TaxID=480035 RepID=UPI0024566565|nr:nucleoside hydrolase [Nocardia wallacei]